MALAQSPSVVTNGLIFYYDQNNIKSLAGPAIQNLAYSRTLNTTSGTGISISGGYETVDIPQVGQSNTVFANIQNNYTSFAPNSADCCPSPISYINAGTNGFTVSPSTLYTYAIVYKVNSGYTNSNYMYRYEYTASGGSYVTEGGVHSDSNRIHLGGGWYWAWGTFTTQATTNWIGYHAAFYYRYSNTTDKLSIAKVLIAQGDYTALHPKYWPGDSVTRSSTQVLRDLTNRNTITATSLTYASDGSFSFDGSTSNLTIPTNNLGNGNLPWTCSAWVKTTTNASTLGTGSILSNQSGGPVWSVMCVNSGKIAYWTYQNSAWAQKLGVGTTVNDNGWHMLTWVNNANNTMAMYVDGVLDSTVADSTSGNNNPIDMIGSSWAAKFAGTIGVVQMYNIALTASQVLQNFNALRGRYGI